MMKKRLYVGFFSILVLGAIAFWKFDINQLLVDFSNSKASSSHLQYYGYYWAYSSTYGDHLTDVASFTNMSFVDTVPGLKRCADLHTQCMLQLRWQFWNGNKLLKNYKTNWAAVKRDLKRNLGASYEGLSGFYMIDEPDLSGVSSADLATVVNLVKEDFPNIPVVTIYSAGGITSTLQVPEKIDLVGFDLYGPLEQVASIVTTLKTRITPSQRIMLVAQSYPARGESDVQLSTLNDQYYNLALSDPRVAGILNFGMWVDDRANFSLLPLTVLRQKTIGHNILLR